jgi:hypothetical protein
MTIQDGGGTTLHAGQEGAFLSMQSPDDWFSQNPIPDGGQWTGMTQLQDQAGLTGKLVMTSAAMQAAQPTLASTSIGGQIVSGAVLRSSVSPVMIREAICVPIGALQSSGATSTDNVQLPIDWVLSELRFTTSSIDSKSSTVSRLRLR